MKSGSPSVMQKRPTGIATHNAGMKQSAAIAPAYLLYTSAMVVPAAASSCEEEKVKYFKDHINETLAHFLETCFDWKIDSLPCNKVDR
jgi:hypothetical protein